MDNISNLKIVRISYSKVVVVEMKFRKQTLTEKQVLEDTQEACCVLSIRNTKSEEFKHLQLGIGNFLNYTITKFNIDEAITAVSKTAYLAEILKNDNLINLEKYDNPLQIKDWVIEIQQFNKLKKNNPEAFFQRWGMLELKREL